METRIYGVGVDRTGGHSLKAALRHLKFRVCHYLAPYTGQIAMRWMTRWDDDALLWLAGTQEAWLAFPAICYRRLDVLTPGAKYILTTRDADSWWPSICRLRDWQFERLARCNKPTTAGEMYMNSVFGREYFDGPWTRGHAVGRMEHHNEGVRRYFAGRPGDLLDFDLTKPGAWGKLAPFVGRPVPTHNFPWIKHPVGLYAREESKKQCSTAKP